MEASLFRKEVLEAHVDSPGSIALTTPLRTSLLIAAAVGAAMLVVAFLILAPYTRRASVTGQLVPTRGLVSVVAPTRGVLAELATEEGARVRAGQVLAQVRVPLVVTGGDDAIAALQARLRERELSLQAAMQARLQLLDSQMVGLRAQREAARHEQRQVAAELEARRWQLDLAGQSLARLRGLQQQRYVSAMQVEQQQSSVLDYMGQVQATQRLAAGTARSLAQLDQALAELPGQRLSAEAEHRRALAQLAQERLEMQARGGQAVKAPVAGVVATPLVKPGQAVEAGQPLLSVLPHDAPLEAELWVPSRAIGFVAPGNAVMLRYAAFPYQKFGHQRGTVRHISRTALGSRETSPMPGGSAGEPYYRVVVRLQQQVVTAYGKGEPLRPGMLLEADILGERRRLIEWIFEPLYAIHGRVGAAP